MTTITPTPSEDTKTAKQCSCAKIAATRTVTCLYDIPTATLHYFDGQPCVQDAD